MGQYGPNLNLPNAPTQYKNPLLSGSLANQSGLANRLTSGNFTGDLSWLSGLTNPNSGYLQNALSAAQGTLQPQFRDTIQQIQNSAAANGSSNSSTFTDALTRAGSDLNSQYQSMVGNAAMQDYTNANQNRMSLFGSGLQLGQQGISNQMQEGNNTNAFNLDNYGNIVAKAIQDNTNLQNYPDLSNLLKSFASGRSGGSSINGLNNSPLGRMFGDNLSGSVMNDTFGQPVPNFNATVPSSQNGAGPMYQPPTYDPINSYAPISPMYGSATTPYTKPGSAFLGSNLTFSAPKINNSLFTKN